MVVTFFQGFGKRTNSTLRPPAAATKYDITGCLKEPCSVQNPRISIQHVPQGLTNPSALTYAYIAEFGRYYFVEDWIWNTALWDVSLTVDVLATYRTEIGNSYAYVERCAHTYNPYAVDNLYPTTTEIDSAMTHINTPWNGVDEKDGTYILGVVQQLPSNYVAPAGGAVAYYALNKAEMFAFHKYMLSDDFYEDAGFLSTPIQGQQLTMDTAKGIINPMQYIVSCTWFPCARTKFNVSGPYAINIGPWMGQSTTIGEGYLLYDRVAYIEEVELALPLHPQASLRGKYLNKSPYSQHYVIMPPFGSFPIDTSVFDDIYTNIRFDLKVDAITGQAALLVGSVNPNDVLPIPRYFYEAVAQFGVPIQLAQSSSDTIGTVVSGVSGIAGLIGGIAGGSVATSIMGLQTLGDAVKSSLPVVYTTGGAGSFLSYDLTTGVLASITSKFYHLVGEDNAELGRPLGEVRRLGDLNGYIKCGEATVAYAAFDNEQKMIQKFLLDGFFRE